MTLTLGILFTVYLACGVLAYGQTYYYFQDKWPGLAWPNRNRDRWLAFLMGMLGPAGLIIATVLSPGYRFGYRYRAITEEESWKAHQAQWPGLSKKVFYGG